MGTGSVWSFFTFQDTVLEEQFWDSTSQRTKRWWAIILFLIFVAGLFQTVWYHITDGLMIPLIAASAASLLHFVLALVAQHSGWYHRMQMPVCSIVVLNALVVWSCHALSLDGINRAKASAVTGTTLVCSDAEVARMNAEVVRALIERLELEIIKHFVSVGIMTIGGILLMTTVNVNWCKTVVLKILSSFIMMVVWQLCIPVSSYDMSNKLVPLVSVILVLPIAVCIAITTERRKVFLGNFLQEQQRAYSQEADSILNHTLKNTMSDAAGQLEICLDDPDSIADLDASTIQSLKLALASLQRGMKCCRNRQMYISLVSGTYISVKRMVNVHRFLSDVTMGRAVEVETRLDVDEVELDPVLMDLILDNAVANATKHGHPTRPNVRITVEGGVNGSTVFQVSNVANPNSEVLSAGFVESMFSGEERDKHHMSNALLSSGVGLQHTERAARASGTAISLWQEGSLVIFQAVPPSSGAPPSMDQKDEEVEVEDADQDEDDIDVSDFRKDIQICCIDDTALSLRTLEIGLQRHIKTAKVYTYGQNGPDDVPLFMAHAPSADIIIFDNHIDFTGEHISGVELLRTIKAGGFQGLLVIRSGNTSDEDILQYREAGCHCVVGKEIPIKQATTIIKKAYLHQQASRALPNEVQAFSSAPRDSDAHFSMI